MERINIKTIKQGKVDLIYCGKSINSGKRIAWIKALKAEKKRIKRKELRQCGTMCSCTV